EEIRAFTLDKRRPPRARVVAFARLFDFDDSSAHIGEHHRAVGTGENSCEIEHRQTMQGCHIVRISITAVLLRKSIMRLFMLAFLVATITPRAAAAQQEPVPNVPTIVTTGEATIHRAPDQAFVSVSVETRARLPRDAQKQNADAMSAVQQKLVAIGFAKEVVRTTGYSITQEFDFSNGRRVPRDYIARNGVEIRVDAVERVGEALDAVV